MLENSLWCLTYPGIQTLDLTGPFEVFNGANEALKRSDNNGTPYDLRVVGTTHEVTTESGLRLLAEPLPDPGNPPHTLLIPGGTGVHQATRDPELVEWVQELARRGVRIVTVCTGTFLAGAAGLLRGQTVTTHWARARRLQAEFPECTVAPDTLFIRDDALWSSAGVTAGIDLALALVEEDLGIDVAQEVARWLVVFLRRPGGQSQFAPPIWNRPAQTSPIRAAQDLINADPAADLSVPTIASHVGVSARHFSRLFHHETGETPGRYVEAVRVSVARHHLEQSADSVAQIARRCGFASPEILRRAFHRQLGTSPDTYRKHHARSS